MAGCKLNPYSIKLELVCLIVFSVLLVATTYVFASLGIPLYFGFHFAGIPFALIASAFGIPAAKLPQHRAYSVTAAVFAVLSALCFFISACSYIYAVCVLTSYYPESDNVPVVHAMVGIVMGILVFCTTLSFALVVKVINTAIHHQRSPISQRMMMGPTTMVVLSPSTESNYMKMPPPLPLGEPPYSPHAEDDLPPPYAPPTQQQQPN